MANIQLFSPPATTALLEGGAKAVLIPWKKQPPKGYKYECHGIVNTICTRADKNQWLTHPPPCQPGDLVHFLETWAEDIEYFPTRKVYLYKADLEEGKIGWGINSAMQQLEPIKWRSPATMSTKDPNNTPCRHVMVCGTVEAVQVKDIGYQQSKACGFEGYIAIIASSGIVTAEEELQQWFTKTYPDLTLDNWCWIVTKEGE